MPSTASRCARWVVCSRGTLTRQDGEKLSDIELLKFYARQWDRYTTGASYVHKLFNYLNKHWVKREKDEGRKDVYSIYTVGLH